MFLHIQKDYIHYQIEKYFYNWEEEKEKEPKRISNIEEPLDNEYGGFWYKKGYDSQKNGLIRYYKKFGFRDEPKIHLDWNCFGEIPSPSMICSL